MKCYNYTIHKINQRPWQRLFHSGNFQCRQRKVQGGFRNGGVLSNVLKDYMIFVSRIREYSQQMSLNEAVERSIRTCIDEDILAEFLRKNRAEVLKVSIYEYNEALHIRQEREAAKEDGWQEGLQEGRKEGRKQGREEGIQQGLQRGAFLERIRKIQKKAKKGLSAETIADMLEEERIFVEEIMKILKDNPDADVEKIYYIARSLT